jgi:uncharacterized membrane protein
MGPIEPPDFRDPDNPYAPPQSAFVPAPVAPLQAGMRFSVTDVLDRSWSIFKARMSDCMAIFWGTFGINLGISFGVGMLVQTIALAALDSRLALLVAPYVAQIISLVVGLWLAIGQSRAYLKIVRNEQVTFAEVFQGGRYLLTMLIAVIIVFTAAFVMSILGGVVSALGLAAIGNQSAGGILVFVAGISATAVLSIYLMIRLSLFYYLIIDRDAGVIDSLGQSWQLTRNQAGTILLVYLLTFAITLAGVLALCVGLIFAWPIVGLLMPMTYIEISGTGPRSPEKAELIWEDEL